MAFIDNFTCYFLTPLKNWEKYKKFSHSIKKTRKLQNKIEIDKIEQQCSKKYKNRVRLTVGRIDFEISFEILEEKRKAFISDQFLTYFDVPITPINI